jgi:hypothetical protein
MYFMGLDEAHCLPLVARDSRLPAIHRSPSESRGATRCVRFRVDAPLPPSPALALRQAGYGTVSVREIGMHTSGERRFFDLRRRGAGWAGPKVL